MATPNPELMVVDQAATQGVAESAHTVARWNETPSGGGIRWNTYRATCRFEGEFKNIVSLKN